MDDFLVMECELAHIRIPRFDHSVVKRCALWSRAGVHSRKAAHGGQVLIPRGSHPRFRDDAAHDCEMKPNAW
jgi:hypothetical protein